MVDEDTFKLVFLENGKVESYKDPQHPLKKKEATWKIVEKEVEVEKIVEKPVYQDKVVHVEREIPVETIREKKEMVYVPLPTDDEELLKRGPFKAPDYDKDKKK